MKIKYFQLDFMNPYKIISHGHAMNCENFVIYTNAPIYTTGLQLTMVGVFLYPTLQFESRVLDRCPCV
eukprot:UN27277